MPTSPSATGPIDPAALAAFRSARHGFHPHRGGWLRGGDAGGAGGAVAVAPLAWLHADASPAGDDAAPRSALALLVAYDPALGFTDAGWLGFAIALGGVGGTLLSHMLGVREDARGARGLGRSLKLLQGHEALRTGHTAAVWTFDPMRGANARLNLEKLGAVVDLFTVDKYGPLRSDLYGPVPSDRLTARWDLVAPTTAARLRAIGEDRYRGVPLGTLGDVPEVATACLAERIATRPPRLRYRIPDDVDRLMRHDPAAAIRWRREMRTVFSALLTTRSAAVGHGPAGDPLARAVREEPGAYAIGGFATGVAADGERASFYLLDRTEETG